MTNAGKLYACVSCEHELDQCETVKGKLCWRMETV